MGKPTLCLDFDGVLHSYTSGWTSADEILDPPTVGAMAFLDKAVEEFEVCIYSSRSHQSGGIGAMRHWTQEHLIQALGAARGMQVFLRLAWPTEKPSAKVSIDDRSLTFVGVWPSIDALLKFKPWNEALKRPRGVNAENPLASGSFTARSLY